MDPNVSPPLYFKESNPRSRSWKPNPLIRVLGLAVWDDWLLTRRAEIEMAAIGIMLLVVFIFDWGAWSLLFNAILHSKLLVLDLLTLPALLFGGLIAAAVIIYERQFVTADFSQGMMRALIPMGLRLSVILASAAVTAQPVELLFFQKPIQNRMHEEGIRVHVGNLLKKLRDLDTVMENAGKDLDKVESERECLKFSEDQSELEKTENQQVELTLRLKNQESAYQRWRRDVNTYYSKKEEAQSHLDGLERMSGSRVKQLEEIERARRISEINKARETLDQAERNYNFAVSRRDVLQKSKENTARELEGVNGLLPVFGKRFKDSETKCNQRRADIKSDVKGREDLTRAQQDKIRVWVRELIEADPGQVDGKRTIIGKQPYVYRMPTYDFFAQLRVLRDLRKGIPPRWKGSGRDEIDLMSSNFGLANARDCDALEKGEPKCTDEEEKNWDSLKAQARQLTWAWMAVYAVAMIIPLLVIAIKLLFPMELKNYYSMLHQDAAGNPEARRLMEVQKKVRYRAKS